MREWSLRLGLASVSALVALLVSEAVLRSLSPDVYHTWTARATVSFRLPAGRAPGVPAISHFTTNARGIRGDAFADGQHYRILAIGGSSTECLLLDDSLAWPHLVQDALNSRFGAGRVWVGNVGRSGLRAVHHQLQATYLPTDYPRIDAVIVLVGINDLQYRLGLDTNYRVAAREAPDHDLQAMQSAFDELPRRYRPGPWYKRTELWRRLRAVKYLVRSWTGAEGHMQDESGSNLVAWRQHREAAARIRDTLPDLAPALAEYADRLRGIIDAVARQNRRVILLTQPTMWRPDLPPELQRFLWLGGIGDFQGRAGSDYYSVAALSQGMALYNQTLLRVCRERQVECLDLDRALAKDTTVFYDDVHFNEPGARKVAALVTNYLLARGPLANLGPSQPAIARAPE